MNSCIYNGQVNHTRLTPRQHNFSYSLFMMYVDLDELPELFSSYRLWAVDRRNIASFWRRDHFGHPNSALKETIQNLILKQTGDRISGPIRLLTHFRYFGYIFNPLSLYYCFDSSGREVEYVIAEVSNTPWKEMHCYVIPNQQPGDTQFYATHDKEFHVSPFMDLNMEYRWKLGIPNEALQVEIENWSNKEKVFSANIALKRKAISAFNLNQVLTCYPLMTLKVTSAIHFEALKLWSKGLSYVPHPGKH